MASYHRLSNQVETPPPPTPSSSSSWGGKSLQVLFRFRSFALLEGRGGEGEGWDGRNQSRRRELGDIGLSRLWGMIQSSETWASSSTQLISPPFSSDYAALSSCQLVKAPPQRLKKERQIKSNLLSGVCCRRRPPAADAASATQMVTHNLIPPCSGKLAALETHQRGSPQTPTPRQMKMFVGSWRTGFPPLPPPLVRCSVVWCTDEEESSPRGQTLGIGDWQSDR